MSLRKVVDESIVKEIETIIKRNKNAILLNSKIVKCKIDEEWKDRVSRQFFDENFKNNSPVSEKHNLINFEKMGIGYKLLNSVKKIYSNKNVLVRGNFHYPNTGYMSWHTNSDFPCTRIYITWTETGNKSFFRYIDPITNETITDYDDAGITIREFDITNKPPYLWHAVGSECDRISFGYGIN
jgi:hypothetical protein